VPISTSYAGSAVRVENVGHTMQYTYDPGSTITVGKDTFELVQFHFHAGSEHTSDGVPSDMEMHLVHVDDGATPKDPFDDRYVVISILIAEDPYTTNYAFDAALDWSTMAGLVNVGDIHEDKGGIYYVRNLLPPNWITAGYPAVRYDGSLTTPPCSETVHWIVADYPLFLSSSQIASFTNLYSANFREAQALNKRPLMYSYNGQGKTTTK